MNKILLIFFICFFISCNERNTTNTNGVWIGGQIINPKSDYVRLYKGEQFLDSILLNKNNFFMYRKDSLDEGLYMFTHNEFQIFYLKPGDSLMFRVNTLEFDESLTYSGIGAERNNFLMEMFLINEEENKIIPEFYALSPEKFCKKLDSLKQQRKNIYKLYQKDNVFDSKFDVIAQASINYDYFSKKELYTSVNRYKNKEFPDDFFAYRDSIDLKNKDLQWYFSYYRLLNRYFDNLVWENQPKDMKNISKNSFYQTYNKLILIDSLVQNQELKNSMLKNNAKRFFETCNNTQEREKLLAQFLKTSTNEKHKEYIKQLTKKYQNLKLGNTIPNVLLTTTNSTYIDLHSIINKPTVLYFWSLNAQNHNREIHKKVNKLSKNFQEFDFLGINLDTNTKKWQAYITNNTLNSHKEYQFKNSKKATKNLVISSLNKAFIISKEGVIIENNANMFSPTFEKLITKSKHSSN